MNRKDNHNPDLNPSSAITPATADIDPIDRILATEPPLVPTSGFLASVMETIQDEALKPAPIPFPWKRAVPGILLAAGVFGFGTYEFVKQAIPAARDIAFTQPHLSIARPVEQAGWVAAALAVSLVSWLVSRRLTGQSGLL
jgi:hypothetical protein